MSGSKPLSQLSPGMPVLIDGAHYVEVSAELAARFAPGDRLYASSLGELLHVPAQQAQIAEQSVGRALAAFRQMGSVTDERISAFFDGFAARLADDAIWRQIREVNTQDVADAKARGRSTTRLCADDTLRENVIAGLRGWSALGTQRGRVLERVQHAGWSAELVGAELGVVAFVFEGRPNVVADACGVLRGGNTVVFRIGRDALATAKSMLALALTPALRAAGLPEHAVELIDSAEHAAGWALFSDPRLSLAVARGSGPAVATLGSLAARAGVPVSLHGTGGAWLCAGPSADPAALERAVFDSLDRKVCNTLNVCCIPEAQAPALVPAFLRGLERAAARRHQSYKLHVQAGSERHVDPALFTRRVAIRRANGDVLEPQAERLPEAELGTEWEWEDSPEVTLSVVPSSEHAVELFNRYSPQFVASLISQDEAERTRFWQGINAPFVGDGFTRWVDGQFALKRPELGLSNWQNGRLFARGGILTGDGVFSVRTRVRRDA